jgi:dienelactone hydrolase
VQLDRPTPIVYVMHGATASEECVIGPIKTTKNTRVGVAGMADSWLDLGWIVIAARGGSTPNTLHPTRGKDPQWGNEKSRLGTIDAWRWASSVFTPSQDAAGNPHGFLLYGFSMGGAVALNFAIEAKRQNIPVAALAAVDGVTNLAQCAARNSGIRTGIVKAYALPKACSIGDANWNAKLNLPDGGHDPQHCDVDVFPGIPMRFSACANDTTVTAAQNAFLFVDKLTAGGYGSEVGLVKYSGGHCAVSHFRPQDTNPFFQRALLLPSTVTTTTTTTESSTTTTTEPPTSTTTTEPETTTTTTEPETTTTTIFEDTTTTVP